MREGAHLCACPPACPQGDCLDQAAELIIKQYKEVTKQVCAGPCPAAHAEIHWCIIINKGDPSCAGHLLHREQKKGALLR